MAGISEAITQIKKAESENLLRMKLAKKLNLLFLMQKKMQRKKLNLLLLKQKKMLKTSKMMLEKI